MVSRMNKARQIGFLILLCLPFVFRGTGVLLNGNLRDVQESYFAYMVMCLTGLFVGNIWLGAFLILNVLLYIYNGQQVGNVQVLNVLFGCLLFMFSRHHFKKNKFSDLYPWMMGLMALNLLWMFLQLCSIDPIFIGQTNENGGTPLSRPFSDPVGFFGIKMANGIFFTSMLPIVASVNPLVAGLLAVPIYMSRSSGVALATAIAVLFYTYHLHRNVFKWLAVILPIIGVLYIGYDLKDDPKTFKARFPVWHSAIRYTFSNPYGLNGLIGYGPDSYRNYSDHKNFMFAGDDSYNHGVQYRISDKEMGFIYYSPSNDMAKVDELNRNIGKTSIAKGRFDVWDNPHSGPIQMLFQYGLIGLFLLIMLTREMWLRFRFAMKDKELVVISSCIIVYYVTSLTHFPLELARLGYLFPILLGAFYARTDSSHAS